MGPFNIFVQVPDDNSHAEGNESQHVWLAPPKNEFPSAIFGVDTFFKFPKESFHRPPRVSITLKPGPWR